jgi:PAS domain S-box-containing protein
MRANILVLGANARATGYLGGSERFVLVGQDGIAGQGVPPAAVVALPCSANIEQIARLRYDRRFDDVPFIALAYPAPVHVEGVPNIVFDDWFDIDTMSAEVFLSRLEGVLNAAGARATAHARWRMLEQLNEILREAADPAEMTSRAARLLGQTLGVNRCAYADVESDEDTFNLTGDYNHNVDSIVGRYRFAQFGDECLRLMRAGLPYVVEDSELDARTVAVRPSYRATRIRAVVCVPLQKNGRFVAAMAVHQDAPRNWHLDEVKLLLAVADRCWESIERAKIERELAAKDARFRALVETVSAVIWHTDEDGLMDGDNPSWSAFTGQSPEQYRGTGWFDALHPEDREPLARVWKEAVRNRSAYAGSYRLRRHDGQYRSMMARGALVGEQNGQHGWVGNCLDVTDMRLAEQRLIEASTRLQFTLDSAQIADWDLDLQSRTCTGSGRLDRLLGDPQRPGSWHIDRFFERLHPDDVRGLREAFERSVRTRDGWRFECRAVWPDGSTRWLLGSGYHYEEADTQKRRMLGIAYDVTARKESELALLEADRRKDEFLAMLAHELRNPLAPIAAAAELLKACQEEPARLAQASAVIARQVRHMTGLIDDLLDVSRVTRGLVRIDRCPCDLRKVSTLAVEQVRSAINARQHALSVALPAIAPMVLGDESRLVQVVANLLNNAAKYTPPGGRIELRIEADGEQVSCSVSDNGLGMAPEFIGRAFDLFSQADIGLARSSGGLGLGLALVRSLVQMHDGTVVARSAGPGLGSQFTVTLPRCHLAAVAAPLPDDVAQAAAALHIAVVDDNADGAGLLAELLRTLGHTVSVFHHPRDLMRFPALAAVDVFLLDIGLPDIDGKMLARGLRNAGHTQATILALSGYGESIYADDQRQLFDGHFLKPVDFQKLLAALPLAGRAA